MDAVDLHGSWADDFENFFVKNQEALSDVSVFTFIWENAENDELWANIQVEKYDYIRQ